MPDRIALKSIINDKVSGSSEILERLNDYLSQNLENIPKLRNDLNEIKKGLPGFAAIIYYIKNIEIMIKNGSTNKLKLYLTNFSHRKDESYKRIYNCARSYLSKFNIILTLSNSKTLLEVFKLWSNSNHKLRIIVCESRPKNEGVIFAKALAKEDIKVELITDASIANYISKADTVIIGADIILKEGNVVNKTGSRNAAIICRHFNKPFIVFATKDKFSNKKTCTIAIGKPREILKGNYKNIKVSNSYFEEIEKSLITKIITDKD